MNFALIMLFHPFQNKELRQLDFLKAKKLQKFFQHEILNFEYKIFQILVIVNYN